MLECIFDNYRPAIKSEAIQYCYLRDTLWAQNGEEGDVFDYAIWEKDYFDREKQYNINK